MDGVLVIDKPGGITSHDVVSAARRSLRETRIGHTGTLDPLATGVLPLVCGRATRLARFLTASDKSYEATIRFGLTTDSYDVDGAETSRSGMVPTHEAVEAALASLRGEYLQMPPSFSAKKVAGTRAYTLARQQQAVTLSPVPVRVTRADLQSFDGSSALVSITCSAGFYVRSFAHALGELVGTGACLERLRRTRSGDFELEMAVTLDQLRAGPDAVASRVLPMERLLPALPAVIVTAEGVRRVSHGRELEQGHYEPAVAGAPDWVRLLDDGGQLLALAAPGQSPGSLHPSIVLN